MKINYLIILILCWCNLLLGQEEVKLENLKTVKFGLSAGLNYDQLSGQDMDMLFANDKSIYQMGFHAGVFVHNQLGKYFGLGHELSFSQKRFGINLLDHSGEIYETNLTTNYIQVSPINAMFYWSGLRIFARPYVSTLVASNLKKKDETGQFYKDRSIYGKGDDAEDDGKYLQKFDFGAQAGIAYQFKFGLLIEARYSIGVIPLFQYASSYDKGVDKNRINIHNQGFKFSLGYAF